MKPIEGVSQRLEYLAQLLGAQYEQSKTLPKWDTVYTAEYRWEHTLRVAQYGAQIAQGESLDRELCVAACLLHDIAYFHCGAIDNWKHHGRIGAELCRPILTAAGFSKQESDIIRYAVACHVDGDSGFAHPHTPVADAVSDADNVDRFSAIRLMMWCMTERASLETMAATMRERVVRLHGYLDRNPLNTQTGQGFFARQIELQLDFFQAFIRDAEHTQFP